MLNLAAETDPDWAERALGALDEILIDHAHCEKKAASTALARALWPKTWNAAAR